MTDKRISATEKMANAISELVADLLAHVTAELRDAADDIHGGAASQADLVARLRSRAGTLDAAAAAIKVDIAPMVQGMSDDIVEIDRRTWRSGFEAGLRTFAHWHDGEQQVGSTGTTLKAALQDLADGKFDDDFEIMVQKRIYDEIREGEDG